VIISPVRQGFEFWVESALHTTPGLIDWFAVDSCCEAKRTKEQRRFIGAKAIVQEFASSERGGMMLIAVRSNPSSSHYSVYLTVTRELPNHHEILPIFH
jgi:hypothetical protein